MKIFLTLIGLFFISGSLLAQNDYDSWRYTRLRDTSLPISKKNYGQNRKLNITSGINAIYTEGDLKRYINPWGSINVSVEMHKKHCYYALEFLVAPTRLSESFVENNHVWSSDTTVSLATIGVNMGYEFWTSKRLKLFLFGGLGYSNLTIGSNTTHENQRSSQKKAAWSLSSPAMTVGFFFEYWQSNKPSKGIPMPDNFWRLKFAANPRWFRTIGNGIFYEMGLHIGM